MLIALLDTGVDAATPYLHGHVLPGLDIAGTEPSAQAQAKPTDPSALEEHGTEMAGLLVGAGGPAGVTGVAPAATVLPLRVAGWQPDARGGYTVYSRTDQLLAGLERAVDPDGNGDAHDAARIALVPLVEPFAAFTDGPLARAVDGALRLDTLVVAAAGNDGPAGPAFGSVGGPAGAPAALAVGAADAGRNLTQVSVVVRAGLRRAVRPPRPPRRRHPALPGTRSLSVRSGPGSLLPARALTGGRPRRGRSRRRGSGHDRPSCCGCRRGRRDPRTAGRSRPAPSVSTAESVSRWSCSRRRSRVRCVPSPEQRS